MLNQQVMMSLKYLSFKWNVVCQLYWDINPGTAKQEVYYRECINTGKALCDSWRKAALWIHVVLLLAKFIYVLWRHRLSELDCCKAEFTVLPRVTVGLGTIMLYLAQVGWHCLGSRWPIPFNHQVYHQCWICQEHACAVEVPCVRYVGVLKLCDCLNISTSLCTEKPRNKA